LQQSPGAFTPLSGTVTRPRRGSIALGIGGEPPPVTEAWTATRDLTVGLWKDDSASALTKLAIRNWEGAPFSEYRAKYVMIAPAWQPKRATTTWADSSRLEIASVSSFEAGPLMLNRLTATLSEGALNGTVIDRAGLASSWTATRLAEDADF